MRFLYYIGGTAVSFAAVWLIISLLASLSSYQSPKRGYIGVCQTGGPIEGNNGTCGVMQPGSHKRQLGKFNDLRQFPITQRNITVGNGSEEGIRAQTLSTKDGVLVTVTARAVFTLDQKNVLPYYANYGQREYGGEHPYTDSGWKNFVRIEMGPVFEQAMRQMILSYDCVQLQPACGNLKGNIEAGAGAQSNILDGQQRLGEQFTTDLEASLDGGYFTNVRVTQLSVTLPGDLQQRVNKANAAKADQSTAVAQGEAAKAKAKAQAVVRVTQAQGEADAKRAEAQGVRAINNAYEHAQAKAAIDAIAALPDGLQSLVIGGSSGLNLIKTVK